MCHLGKIINYKCQCGKTLANKNIKEGLMKKFLKFGAALTALVLGLACFAACSNDDDGGSRSVVAEYVSEDYTLKAYYIFYNDDTYEYKKNAQVQEKGKYYNSPTKRGAVTIEKQYWFDPNSEKFIPESFIYEVIITKNGDDLYLEDEDYGTFILSN